jgi:tRNA/tmRNA/rRNA uracil-C5-methylase (TrmA/RlmC/RlmD family)
VQYAVDGSGSAGLHAHRSWVVVPVDDCRIATGGVRALDVTGRRWPGWAGVEAVVSAGAHDALLVLTPAAGARRRPRVPAVPDRTSVAVATGGAVDRVRGRTWVREQVDVGGTLREFRVTGSGFWQVHPGAAPTLVSAVLEALAPQPGERVLDLFAGAGLFVAALAGGVGDTGSVLAVEGSARAVADARRSLHDLPHVRLERGRVDAVLARLGSDVEADLVVLDPPRTGAGRRVVEQVAALAPRAIAYVACDPAALARDVAWFGERGYVLDGLRAFDIFPMTHHIECVARLVPRR